MKLCVCQYYLLKTKNPTVVGFFSILLLDYLEAAVAGALAALAGAAADALSATGVAFL